MKNLFSTVRPLLVLSALIVGCADSNELSTPPVMSAIDELEALKSNGAKAPVTTPPLDAAEVDFPVEGTFIVDFETTVGNFTVTVQREWAPRGAHHFYELVKDSYYDGCGFFRVVPGFMVQWGLAAAPAQTAKWEASIKDDPVVKGNQRGFITFAKTGLPNSRSTQLFINFGDNSRLDSDGFASFGQVTKGMEVVDAISSAHGESPDQGAIRASGNAYLKENFDKLDYIKTARITLDDLAEKAAGQPTE